jgi:hypothetical protein
VTTDVREQLLEHREQRARHRIRDGVERADEADARLARQRRPLIAQHSEDLVTKPDATFGTGLEPVDRGTEITDRVVEVVDDPLDPNTRLRIRAHHRRD